jgi:putative iron-only hydrogenase system regulator
MEPKRHLVTIVVTDIDAVYSKVSEHLHAYAPHILLRVGYPMHDRNASVIFLVMDLPLDEMGAFSGKLGQMANVKVKTITLHI